MKIGVLILTMFFILSDVSYAESTLEETIRRSEVMASEHSGELRYLLYMALDATWYLAGIILCRDIAPSIAQEIGKRNGGQIRTVSLNPLHLNFQPDEAERGILGQMVNDKSAGALKPLYVVIAINETGARSYRIMKPIVANGRCLACHGVEGTLNKDAMKVVHQQYPDGISNGFEAGDVLAAYTISRPLE